MKIRNGFVSNSSSSSFLIYGFYFEDKKSFNKVFEEEIKKFLDDGEDSGDFDVEEIDWCEPCIDGMKIHAPGEWYNIYVGQSWDSIGDDETGRAFKQKIAKWGEKYGLIEPNTFAKAWYN